MKVISDILTATVLVTESAAATWTTEDISLPAAAREAIGITIIGVDLVASNVEDVPGAGVVYEQVEVYLLEEEEAAEPALTDPDIIAYLDRRCHGDGTDIIHVEAVSLGLQGKLVTPENGFKTMRDKCYVGVVSSNSSSAANATARVYFQIAKFSQAELVELGFRESFE